MTQVTPLRKKTAQAKIAFQRDEMSIILDVYGRLVMSGQARDYAIGAHKDQAVFAIFKQHTENPNWTILKTPALARLFLAARHLIPSQFLLPIQRHAGA